MAKYFSGSGKHSFAWKSTRKLQNVSTDLDLEVNEDGNHSNITIYKRRTGLSKKEKIFQSSLLKDEGADLASKAEYVDAMDKWSKAIELHPDDEALYEMKAQVLMILEKDFLAVKCAEKAVYVNKLWWIGWQTLGRCQMNLKDFIMAVKSFSRSAHLNPNINREDLLWASSMKAKSLQNSSKIVYIKIGENPERS